MGVGGLGCTVARLDEVGAIFVAYEPLLARALNRPGVYFCWGVLSVYCLQFEFRVDGLGLMVWV